MSATSACRRCGTCCQQGGPALHGPDLALIRSGALALDHLITVRRGELALAPLGEHPEPVQHEFLKLSGQGGTWCCLFYDREHKGCGRYHQRPMACGVLDCTDPAPLVALAGTDLLTRFDCLAPDDPLLPLIRAHEQACSCPDLAEVVHGLADTGSLPSLLVELEVAVARDLAFRAQVAARHHLSLARELFALGRPLFQLLQPLGLHASQGPTGLRLTPVAP